MKRSVVVIPLLVMLLGGGLFGGIGLVEILIVGMRRGRTQPLEA